MGDRRAIGRGVGVRGGGGGALALLLWLLRERIGRGPLAGALYFALTLGPVLGFVDFGYLRYSFVADRFQYLAGPRSNTSGHFGSSRATRKRSITLSSECGFGVTGATSMLLAAASNHLARRSIHDAALTSRPTCP